MQPSHLELPVINPRCIALENGEAALAEMLAQTGYVIERDMLRDLGHVLRSGKPWLIEGPRGGGKTALAEALALACNLPQFYLQGMEGLELGDVLYQWDREGQNQWVRQAVSVGMNLKEARAEQWTREYLILGEALAAFELAAKEEVVPLLIIDEIDKLSERIEDMLLQLFGRGYTHIPRYGEVGVRDRSRWPVVILLSNDLRHDLSAPLRSRCIYSWLDPPKPQEEIKILQARCPRAPRKLLVGTAKLIQAIRGMAGIIDKPGLRESIDLVEALVAQNHRELSMPVIDSHLCYLAKRGLDLANLRKALARLEAAVEFPNAEVDEWIAELEKTEGRSRSVPAAAGVGPHRQSRLF